MNYNKIGHTDVWKKNDVKCTLKGHFIFKKMDLKVYVFRTLSNYSNPFFKAQGYRKFNY